MCLFARRIHEAVDELPRIKNFDIIPTVYFSVFLEIIMSKTYTPSIKIWQNEEVVLISDELKIELKNIILNIKGDLIQIENKNKIESL